MLDLEDEFGITLPDSSLAAGTFETAATLWAAIEASGWRPTPPLVKETTR